MIRFRTASTDDYRGNMKYSLRAYINVKRPSPIRSGDKRWLPPLKKQSFGTPGYEVDHLLLSDKDMTGDNGDLPNVREHIDTVPVV